MVIKLIMTTSKPKQPKRRSGTINLRVGEVQKEAIDRAAAIQGKSRTEFILDAAYTEATSFLLDRKFFLVDDETFEAFEKQLEAVPDPMQLTALKALLDRPAPWD
jgi:uncharacterized protein (DUF1778 family)